jgi:transcriptional regulator with XRE-family HTH domain
LDAQGSYISNIELGKKTIEDYADLMKIEDIAKALFVDVDWLKSKESKPEQTVMKIETPIQEEPAKKEPITHTPNLEYSSTDIRIRIGKIIRGKRIELGMSEEQAAENANISLGVLRVAEDGRTYNVNGIPRLMEVLFINRNTLLKNFSDSSARERLTAAFVTQEKTEGDISIASGLSVATFSEAKRGKRELRKNNIAPIAAALGVSAEWLRTGGGEPIETKTATAPISKAEPIIQKRKEEITVKEHLFEVEVREHDNDSKGVTFTNLNSNDLVTLMNLASKCGIFAFAVTAE